MPTTSTGQAPTQVYMAPLFSLEIMPRDPCKLFLHIPTRACSRFYAGPPRCIIPISQVLLVPPLASTTILPQICLPPICSPRRPLRTLSSLQLLPLPRSTTKSARYRLVAWFISALFKRLMVTEYAILHPAAAATGYASAESYARDGSCRWFAPLGSI